jgi:hypothetical protein
MRKAQERGCAENGLKRRRDLEEFQAFRSQLL